MTSLCWMPARGRGPSTLSTMHAALQLQLSLLRVGQVGNGNADAADHRALGVVRLGGLALRRRASGSYSATTTLDRACCRAGHGERRLRAGLGAADHAGQVDRGLHRAAVDLRDDVARLDAGLLGRPARLDRLDAARRAPCPGRAIRRRRSSLADDDADPAAHDPPADFSCSDTRVASSIGNRERDAHVTAGAAVDLRVDADRLRRAC